MSNQSLLSGNGSPTDRSVLLSDPMALCACACAFIRTHTHVHKHLHRPLARQPTHTHIRTHKRGCGYRGVHHDVCACIVTVRQRATQHVSVPNAQRNTRRTRRVTRQNPCLKANGQNTHPSKHKLVFTGVSDPSEGCLRDTVLTPAHRHAHPHGRWVRTWAALLAPCAP